VPLTDPFVWLLFAHVGSALVGLGPSFVYPRFGKAAAQQPAHALFALRLSRSLSTRWTHPLALIVLVTGGLLIWRLGYDVLATTWLLVSIVLFLASFLYAAFVQNRDLSRTLAILEQGAPDTLSEADRAELGRLRRRIRYGGMFMRSIVLVVLFLMIAKPTFAV
jgi:uncharacterized membrane protein